MAMVLAVVALQVAPAMAVWTEANEAQANTCCCAHKAAVEDHCCSTPAPTPVYNAAGCACHVRAGTDTPEKPNAVPPAPRTTDVATHDALYAQDAGEMVPPLFDGGSTTQVSQGGLSPGSAPLYILTCSFLS